jgi:hypothetical protein
MPNEIMIETQEDGEACDCVVCILVTEPLAFPDNIVTECCECGQLVQHRPHAPKRPPKICLPCIEPKMVKEAARGELGVMITPKTAVEVAAYLAKKNAN